MVGGGPGLAGIFLRGGEYVEPDPAGPGPNGSSVQRAGRRSSPDSEARAGAHVWALEREREEGMEDKEALLVSKCPPAGL